MFTTERDGGDDVFQVARNYDADGDLAVVRGVHRVECATAGVEADFAVEVPAEGGVERMCVDGRGFGQIGES